MIRHIQAGCNNTIHFAASSDKSCRSGPMKLTVSNDHLTLSTTLTNSVQSYSSPELN